jgi:molecular chaperone DnaK (HSP70)
LKRDHAIDIAADLESLEDLWARVEKAKKEISSNVTSEIHISGYYDGIPWHKLLTHAKLVDINKDLFDETIKPVLEVLDSTWTTKNRSQQ